MRGHGRTFELQNQIKGFLAINFSSGAKKGYSPIADAMHDMELLNKITVAEDGEKLPTFVFGHSLGGLLSLNFAESTRIELAGVISQAPAMKPVNPIPSYVYPMLKLAWIPFIGRHTQWNELDIVGLSSSKEEIEAYKQDPYVHDRISIGLVKDILDTSDGLMKKAASFDHKLVMAQAAHDTFTSVKGNQDFFDSIGSQDKIFRKFENVGSLKFGHELHREPTLKQTMYDLYTTWMKERV